VAIRLLKTVLIAFVALFCLFYATQNMVNLDAAYHFVSAVLSMEGHEAYPVSFGAAINSPALIWAALTAIIALEYLAGLLAAKGAWDLWSARQEPAAEFNASKKFAILGCGMSLVLWYGFFSVMGGAYFQMWQTPLGGGSLQNSLDFVAVNGVIMLFVNMADD
jgi:predicted small integral membrane protein